MSSRGQESRKYFYPQSSILEIPNLTEVQTNSYKWFVEKGLRELFDEISPIRDFSGKNLELEFLDYKFEEPKFSEIVAKEKNITYEAPLRVKLRLTNKNTGSSKVQEVFLGEFPIMTEWGTFIVNGVERVVVTQLIRSSGVFFISEFTTDRELFGSKIIPQRGAWLEFETNSKDVISVRVDRGRRIPVTTFLRALGYGSDEELINLFADVNTDPDHDYIKATIEKDPAKSESEGLIETYKRLRPGELPNVENARALLQTKLFNFRHYDLGRVGRYKINQRLGLNFPIDFEHRVLLREDLIATIKELICLNNGIGKADDIDHLGNRRLRTVGELLYSRFRVGILRLERIIKDRMSICDADSITPVQLINIRPLVATVQEFFASSQLSQFMDQTNPLSELGNKRRLSAMGPGGLSRERAGFEVRDVHHSHYGRICPIETPEGPNIGLVNYLATYARVNEYGFIETPYKKVLKEVQNGSKEMIGKRVHKDLIDPRTGKLVAKDGQLIDSKLAEKIKKLPIDKIPIKSVVTDQIVWLDATAEDKAIIAQANVKLNERGEFVEEKVAVRRYGEPEFESIGRVDYIDVSPNQIVGLTAALIPFLEHDDGNRVQMGANMLRQAVPLIKPESPLVGTGLERKAALDSGHLVICKNDGVVVEASGSEIIVKTKEGQDVYKLLNFVRSNQGTCIHQRPNVKRGEKVKKGDILASSLSIDNDEIALGQNVLVAFMSWGGYNFEDAIIISEDLVKSDRYTSIHIEKFSIDIRDTKLGPEIVTRDIPNVGEAALKNLDEDGIVRIGAEVRAGDILVGKITPKGETELTAEERLLRAIFGEKARDVKDTSLRLPHGEWGKVVDIKIFSKDKGDKLPVGVNQTIQVSVAQLRKIGVGDKMAGRHGNKGVIARILPREDMPYLEDGRPVDIILNPLGITSRLNIGQVFETHLGWAASVLGYKVASPVFAGVPEDNIQAELKKAGLPSDGKITLYDGRTGEAFDERVTVGYIYMLKLCHMVEDKVHARSIGPYSLVTQQPLGGKAQFGGQRFGEMEVWALEGYGAAYTLQEMLTIKSDDVLGRSEVYKSIIKGEKIQKPRTPESFNVLVKELQSLGLDVELLKQEEIKGSEEESRLSTEDITDERSYQREAIETGKEMVETIEKSAHIEAEETLAEELAKSPKVEEEEDLKDFNIEG